MKLYRFVVHPMDDGYHFLECVNDPALFTQARSLDEALYMARDVVDAMYGITGALVELVIPPDVSTAFELRRVQRKIRSPKKNGVKARALASSHK
jgi:hypothetical protein